MQSSESNFRMTGYGLTHERDFDATGFVSGASVKRLKAGVWVTASVKRLKGGVWVDASVDRLKGGVWTP